MLVIGSSSGAIPDTIGEAGLIFPGKGATALAQKMKEVLGNPLLRDRLRQAGLSRAKAFAWEKIARINYEAYQRVLHGEGPVAKP